MMKNLLLALVLMVGAAACASGNDFTDAVGSAEEGLSFNYQHCVSAAMNAYSKELSDCPPQGSGYYACEQSCTYDYLDNLSFCEQAQGL